MAFTTGYFIEFLHHFRSRSSSRPAVLIGTPTADYGLGGGAGAPTSGTSGTWVNAAQAGSQYTDITNVINYENVGSTTSPSWAPCNGGLRLVTAKTADYTLTAADVGGLFTTTGATGTVTFTLPAVATSTGYWYDFMNTVGQTMTVTAPANKLVAFNNATATSITFSTASELIGSGVRVVCDGAKWIAMPILGSETATPTIA